jgi:hypothetical protein
MILLAKLDRLAIGSILRSKLVFLVNVRPQHGIHRGCVPSGFRSRDRNPDGKCADQHSAECVDIDNESNQVP